MSEWIDYSLGEVTTINIGGTPSREIAAYWGNEHVDGYPWVSIADMKQRRIIGTNESITRKGVLNSNVKPVPEGSFIMSFKLSIGRAAIAGVQLFTNEAIAAILPKDDRISSDLLYYVLPPVASSAITDSAVKGSTLNKKSLAALTIKVPADQRTQKKIVGILDCIDQTIEKTEALIKKYQQIKAGLMHDLFTRGIGDDGKLRPPREQAPQLYQKTAIGWIPKDWASCSCQDVCEKIIDCKNRTPPITPDGHPVIRTPNVRDGRFVDTELVYTDSHSYRIWTARGKPKPGDVVITREAPVGEVCKIPDRHEFACLGQRMMLYRTDSGKVDNDYFLYALQSEAIQSRLDLISGGSTVGHVRVGDIRDLWFIHPTDRTEQELIAKALNRVSKNLECEVCVLVKLKKKKSGLMHDLLTGRVEVSDGVTEVANN